MGGIKYYQLAKGEELPDEFCVVMDIGGEPSEYTFYVPEAENAKLRESLEYANNEWEKESTEYLSTQVENAKLRELVRDMWRDIPKSKSCGWDTSANCCSGSDECKGECAYWYRMRELGVKVNQ